MFVKIPILQCGLWICFASIQVILPQDERSYEFISREYLKHKIVPDCLDVVPKHHLQVEFYKHVLDYGSVLKVEDVNEPPSCLRWPIEKGAYYAMAFVGLDVPIREVNTESEFQHFLVVNIPGTGPDFYYADYPTMYVGLNPVYEPGSHRLVFTVFKQPGKIHYEKDFIPNTFISCARANFSTRKFAEDYNLGEPYAGNFFVVNMNDSILVPDHQDQENYY
nr:PREDICTED: protein D2-like [Bemisia tabaci]